MKTITNEATAGVNIMARAAVPKWASKCPSPCHRGNATSQASLKVIATKSEMSRKLNFTAFGAFPRDGRWPPVFWIPPLASSF